jgi:3-keto-5-aminohexanoate cleavage enzyme
MPPKWPKRRASTSPSIWSTTTSSCPDMTKPCIICVAITGSLPRKADNPAVPITVSEQVESTHAAWEAGASIVALPCAQRRRNPQATPRRFARLLEGLRQHCPGLIVQFSTGGRSGAGQDAGGDAALRPDMASPDGGVEQLSDPGLREPARSGRLAGRRDADLWRQARDRGFDLSHIHQAARCSATGGCAPLYVQFVMGVKNAMPADRDVFDYYIRDREAPSAGRGMVRGGDRAGRSDHPERMERGGSGGHARTGLEDNVRLDRRTLAPSNAALTGNAETTVRAGRWKGNVTPSKHFVDVVSRLVAEQRACSRRW